MMGRKKKGQFSESDLNAAIKLVRDGNISKREACRLYKIGRATLDRYLSVTSSGEQAKKISKTFTNTIFSEEEEKVLAFYVINCSKMFYGLTVDDLCRLAWQFAVVNEKTFPSTWAENRKAGTGWSSGFRHRHSLSLRVAEGTSLARASAFNKSNVKIFNDVYMSALETHPFEAMNIWNLDETGVSTVTKIPKILAQKGERQVGGISSAERGVLITLCACVNAAGRALAPVLLYPRKKIQAFWSTNAPPGTLVLANDSGWMTSEQFPVVLDHFIKQMGASKENPQLLIFDNHASHVTLDVVTKARDTGVTIVTLPSHCSHKMQPLDVSVMFPFKTYYSNEACAWHRTNPGRSLSIHDVSGLVKTAFNKAFTIHNIVKGFERSGIWPPNSDALTEADFLGASPTDQPLEHASEQEQHRTPAKSDDLPGSSRTVVSPEIIRPLPKAPARKLNSCKGREKRIPVVLTSTPQKDKLELKQSKKIVKQSKKIRKAGKILELFNNDLTVAMLESSGNEMLQLEEEVNRIEVSPNEMFLPVEMKAGDWMLVKVKGGRRQSITYRYVVQTLESYDPDEDWVRVQGYRSINLEKTKFQVKESDIFEIDLDDVVCSLKDPALTCDRAVTYEFVGTVDAREA